MDATDKLINTAKIIALQDLIIKMQKEVDKLEQEREDAEKIPF
jgi:hypothetical protein